MARSKKTDSADTSMDNPSDATVADGESQEATGTDDVPAEEIDTDAEIERLMGSAQVGGPVVEDDADADEFTVEGLDDIDSKFIVPNGTYPARCTDIEYGPSKKSGWPMFTFTYTLTSADKHGGKDFKIYATKKPTALFTLNMVLQAYGIPIGATTTFKKSQILNKDVRVIMLEEKYTTDGGEERSSSKIKKVLPAG